MIRNQHPDTGILVLSAHVDVEPAMELLASGQRIGYVLKSRVTEVAELIETVERILQGGSVVDPALVLGGRSLVMSGPPRRLRVAIRAT